MTLPFSYSRSIPRHVVESRVEFVLWQEDGRVSLVGSAYYLKEVASLLTIHRMGFAKNGIARLKDKVVHTEISAQARCSTTEPLSHWIRGRGVDDNQARSLI